jgi:hypothetical protein
MRGFAALCAAITAVLVLGNSAAAGANPDKPTPPGQEKKADAVGQASPPGQEQIPPGQQKKADVGSPSSQPTTSASTAPSVVTTTVEQNDQKEQKQKEDRGRPASAKEHSAPPAAQSRPVKSSSANGNSAVAYTHVIICHRTGSASNPYVVINISLSGWLHGHSTHPDLDGRSDIVLKMGAAPGEKMPESACGGHAGGGGGNTSNDPPRKPADPPGKVNDPKPSSTPAGPTASPATGSGSAGVPRASEGVKGSRGGSDSGVAAQVGETGVLGKLPFTGVPLWIAALLGLVLLATGLVLLAVGNWEVSFTEERAEDI